MPKKWRVWEPFRADAGTYEVKETTVTFRVLVGKDPEHMKPDKNVEAFDFKIEGNTLILTTKTAHGLPVA